MGLNILSYDTSILVYTPNLLTQPEYGNDIILFDSSYVESNAVQIMMKWGGYDVSALYGYYTSKIKTTDPIIPRVTNINIPIMHDTSTDTYVSGFVLGDPSRYGNNGVYFTRQVNNMFLLTDWIYAGYPAIDNPPVNIVSGPSSITNLCIPAGCVFLNTLWHSPLYGIPYDINNFGPDTGWYQLNNVCTHKEWTDLITLILSNNNLYNIDTYPEWTKLQHIDISGNPISSFKTHKEWINISNLSIDNTNIKQIDTYPEWINIDAISAANSALVDISIYSSWNNITAIYMPDSSLSQNTVDNILINIDKSGTTGFEDLGDIRTIELQGCVAPSINGYIAKQNLLTKGWKVYTS